MLAVKASDYEVIVNQLDSEDLEFLSDLDKAKRKEYEEKKNKIYNVISRRRDKWRKEEEERSKLSIKIDLEPVEYEFDREETVKVEERSSI